MMKWMLLATMLDVMPAADAPFDQLRDAYAKCVWTDYVAQLLSPKADSVPLMVERAFQACQAEENLMFSAALLLNINPTLVRATLDSYKVKLKNEIVDPPPSKGR